MDCGLRTMGGSSGNLGNSRFAGMSERGGDEGANTAGRWLNSRWRLGGGGGIRQVFGIRQVSNLHRIHRRERRVEDGWRRAKVRRNSRVSESWRHVGGKVVADEVA